MCDEGGHAGGGAGGGGEDGTHDGDVTAEFLGVDG